jgi:hypothetical protein
LLLALSSLAQEKKEDRLKESYNVLKEILGSPDMGIWSHTSAETDIVVKAEILSWSRARDVFGGVSLKGSTMRSDDGANKESQRERTQCQGDRTRRQRPDARIGQATDRTSAADVAETRVLTREGWRHGMMFNTPATLIKSASSREAQALFRCSADKSSSTISQRRK